MDLTASLSGLVQLLQKADFQQDTVVKHLVYVLPLIKNPQNISLVLAAASKARLIRSLSEATFLINGISAAARRKQEISNPTIPYEEFVEHIANLCTVLDPIFSLCVLTGILLGGAPDHLKHRIEGIIVDFSQTFTFKNESDYLAIVPLAKAQFVLSEDAKASLPSSLLLRPALRVIYNPAAIVDSTLASDSFNDFGAYSHLIGNCLKTADLAAISHYLDVVDSFCRTAAAVYFPDAVQRYKMLIFGVSLQIQGICVQILHNRHLPAPKLARRILTVIQSVAFVLEELGGKFDALEFFTNLCFDVLLETGGPEPSYLLQDLGRNWWDLDVMDVRGRGRLLYMLEIAEKLLPVLKPDVINGIMLGAAEYYLTPVGDGIYTRPVLEAAHSFMLAYLANSIGPLAKVLSADSAAIAIDQYLDKLLLLYPGVFTWAQFKTALNAILTAMAPPNPCEAELRQSVLNRLFLKAKSVMPGTLMPEGDDNGPPTLRAAWVAALITAMPPLCQADEFQVWMDRVDSMIPGSYNDIVHRERRWIIGQIQDSVVDLDLHLADVGIRYWFNRGSHL